MITKLSEFTTETLRASRDNWLQTALELDMPTYDIEKVLDYAQNHIDYTKVEESCSYAVFCENDIECLAVVDVVHSKNNPQHKLIKMLTVDLCPRLTNALINDDMELVGLVVDVYSTATVGTILMLNSHNVHAVKLYGRDQAMRLLLKNLEIGINAKTELNSSAKWEGHWLTIKPNKEPRK